VSIFSPSVSSFIFGFRLLKCGGSRILIFTQSGYRMPDPLSRIPDLGSRISDPGSQIPDPKTATKERVGWNKKIFLIIFYVATNFTKLKIILVLKCWRKKFRQIFKELRNFLHKKMSLSFQKYGFGIRGQKGTVSRIPGSKRHRIPDPDPKHCKILKIMKNLQLMWKEIFLICQCCE